MSLKSKTMSTKVKDHEERVALALLEVGIIEKGYNGLV